MHKSDRIEAGCTVEDEPYKLLERDAEKSILAGPLSSPSEQLPFPASLKAPVPLTHGAVTVPVMFGRPNITGTLIGGGDTGNNTEAKYFTGAFTRTGSGPSKTSRADHGEFCNNAARFEAPRSSSVYGSSTTVQPSSVRSMILIKF